MEIGITKISSKGQVVIPQDLRKKLNIEEGETLSVSSQGNLIVLKKIEKGMTQDELRTLNEIEEAWEEIREGKFKKMEAKDFLNEIKKW